MATVYLLVLLEATRRAVGLAMLVFLPELPRTSNGKIAKNLLRERGRP